MAYEKINFINDSPPAINATALNHMQTQYDEAHNELIEHLADTAQDDDVHGLKTLFQNQQFQNLLKNGDFASWSQGDTAAPDGWIVSSATINKQTDSTAMGGYYARLTANGTWGKVAQDVANPEQYRGKTITLIGKVKANSLNNQPNSLLLNFGVGGGEFRTAIPKDDTWHVLNITATVSSDCILIQGAVEVAQGTSDTDDILEVDWVMLVVGELPVAFANNPMDKALKAVDYQDSAENNYEYGRIAEQNGIGQIDDTASTEVITFPKAFTKLLSIQITPIDTAEVIRAASGSTTGFTATRTGTTGNNQFYWSAKGVG